MQLLNIYTKTNWVEQLMAEFFSPCDNTNWPLYLYWKSANKGTLYLNRCYSLSIYDILFITKHWLHATLDLRFVCYSYRNTATFSRNMMFTQQLQWCYTEHDGISNHWHLDCLLNCLFNHRSKKHQSSLSLAFVRGIYCWPVDFSHKGPVMRKMLPFDDVIMD